MSKTENNEADLAYLRPETAQAIFLDYKNIIDTMRINIPFGVAQIGKAFRNEIVAGNFIFRLREFEQMEIEYFISPEEKWQKLFDSWLEQQQEFVFALGANRFSQTNLFCPFRHRRQHHIHYANSADQK